MKANVTSFFAGLLFALGLAISGMTQPSKVIGFLDFAGTWDPSLAFVMMGAIGVHFFFVRRALKMKAPVFGECFAFPTRTEPDAALVIGAAVFGIGWGLGGYCPGPALVAAVSLSPATGVFVVSMAAGMFAARALRSPTAP